MMVRQDTYDPCPVCAGWLLEYVGDLSATVSAFECGRCGTWTLLETVPGRPDEREVA